MAQFPVKKYFLLLIVTLRQFLLLLSLGYVFLYCFLSKLRNSRVHSVSSIFMGLLCNLPPPYPPCAISILRERQERWYHTVHLYNTIVTLAVLFSAASQTISGMAQDCLSPIVSDPSVRSGRDGELQVPSNKQWHLLGSQQPSLLQCLPSGMRVSLKFKWLPL